MQKRKTTLIVLWALCCIPAFAQKWGYATLIGKQNANSVQLLDTNNAVIKQWSGLSGNTAYSSYLMPGGILWRAVTQSGNLISGGGVCGRIQKVAWDGTVLFDYKISDANQVSHHDFCPLPNGNVIMIVYEKKTAAQVQDAGATVNADRLSEKLVELKPTGPTSAEIVWEWHLWDHMVQNLYSTKANYQTSIIDHPELLNINYKNTGNMGDWVHMNGIDYNAELNQIVVSSHNLNELYVIDHSTTTAEAATHNGGNSGKGGDFLFRWGNPEAYGAAGTKIFSVVHDAHWVPADCPRAGWLGGFNNQGVSNSISSIDLFQPPWNGTAYTHTAGQAYEPATYGYRHQASGYSSNMGSSQQLPNGNMLICLATAGKVYEINAAGTQLWLYSTNGSIPQAKRYDRCYIEHPQVTVASANPTICAGGSVQLDITASATNVNSFTYIWTSNTGVSITNVEDPIVAGITQSAVYTVTVTTANGCTTTASVPVTVAPSPAADAGPDVNIVAGESTVLTAGGGLTYQWSNGANTAQTTVTPLENTIYTVTVTNAEGCSATDAVNVLVSSSSAINAALTVANPEICLGDVTQIIANVSGGSGNYTFNWSSQPAGFSSTLPDPYVNPDQTTTYIVSISDGTNVATRSIQIVVKPLPVQPSISSDGVVLTSSNAQSNNWYYYGNPIPGANGQVYQPMQDGSYQVQTIGANGCFSPLSDPFEYTLPALAATISTADADICLGDVIQLSASVIGASGPITYSWTSNPAGFTSDLPDPFINPEATTVYTLSISDGANTAAASITITVNPLPAQPSITLQGDAMVSSGPTNNQWYYYGNPVLDATGQVFVPTENGSYQVQVMDAAGCFSPLSDPFEYTLVAVHTPLPDTYWTITPNPAYSQFTVLGDVEYQPFTIEMFDATGRLVLRGQDKTTIYIPGMDAGLYWVRLNTTQGYGIKKLVVLR